MWLPDAPGRRPLVLFSHGLGGSPERFVQVTDVLFVQGDRDSVVAYGVGRAAYRQVPGAKGFLTLLGADHEAFLFDRGPESVVVTRTMLDFLCGSLYGDPAARARLLPDGTVPAVSTFEAST